MADDGTTSVALPEVPLLAVLPGTGGLTRLVDKRQVRRDRADYFCTLEEGIKGKRAVEWRLVDEVVPRSRLARPPRAARGRAGRAQRPAGRRARHRARRRSSGTIEGDRIAYAASPARSTARRGVAEITVAAPDAAAAGRRRRHPRRGRGFWPLAVARELDDLILHLRINEEEIGLWVLRTTGAADLVEAHDRALLEHAARLARARDPALSASAR